MSDIFVSGSRDSDVDPLLLSVLTMSAMVEARDPYTGGHLWRVSQYALRLALAAGHDDGQAAVFALGGFLHDLGKIAIPDAILNKPGPLDDDEYAVIRTHPDVGARIVASQPFAAAIKSAIQSHHERPDGKGYPAGLADADLTEAGRIVGICDAFDAMTSHRPYRQGMPVRKALSIISAELGRQFDPTLGQTFVASARAGDFDDIVAHSDRGMPLQECPMCGPTLVIRRDHRNGDNIYCRNCGGENRLVRLGAILRVEPTGQRGSARDLEPDVDHDQLRELAMDFGSGAGAS